MCFTDLSAAGERHIYMLIELRNKCVSHENVLRMRSVVCHNQWLWAYNQLQFNADNVRLGLRRAFWFPLFIGITDFILADGGVNAKL